MTQARDELWWLPPGRFDDYIAWSAKRALARGGVVVGGATGRACLEPSPFDSHFFGLAMAQIVWLLPSSEQCAADLVHEVLDKAREMCWEHIAARIGSSKHGIIQALEECGFRTVDIQATQVHALSEPETTRNCLRSREIVVLDDKDFESVKHIAQGAFRQSRFYADRTLDSDAADRLHIKWLENNLGGRAETNLGAFDHGKAVGFISCTFGHWEDFSKTRPKAHIDLIAVDEAFRGKGIGKTLVLAVLDRYRGRCRVVSVGTQGYNYPAFRLYQACGFRLVSFVTTLHTRL